MLKFKKGTQRHGFSRCFGKELLNLDN